MSDDFSLQFETSLKRLDSTLAELSVLSRRSLSEVLADTVTQITIGGNGVKGLYQEFRALRPDANASIRTAPWGIGRTRRKFGEYGALGLSLKAEQRARDILGSRSSGLFRLTGRGVLGKPVPLTENAKGTRNILFRPGRNALPKYAKVKRDPGEKRLNLRALAIYYELQLRATGVGFSAAQFAIQRSVLGRNLRTAADNRASVRLRTLQSSGGLIGAIDFNPESATIRGTLELRSDVSAIEIRVINAALADKEARLSQLILKNFK